uniref:7TM GPCR serpentine receptor class x (Srx) domain-containing protein n=1 Tax=Panagrolaimus sp. JU765 TaxID=591449 RepID=A0AC34PVH1_9BILA
MAFIQIFCGSFILMSGLAAFVLNVQVLFVLYQAGFLNSKHNSVYILAFANIVGNTVQLFVSFAYLGPTSILQKDYFEEGPESFGTNYAYLQTGFNYVNTYIDMPVNSSSSFISILCYIIIFIYVRQNNIKASQFNRELSSIRRTKEIRYAIQFAFCSVFALFAWVTFRIFPLIVPADQLAWFTFIAFCVIAHSVANSLIFVGFNKEFKDKFFQKGISSNNSNQNFSSHYPNTTNPRVQPASHETFDKY